MFPKDQLCGTAHHNTEHLGLSYLFVSLLSASLHKNVRPLGMGPIFNFLFPTCNPQYIFPCGSAGKESACNAGDLRSIPGSGRSLGEGNSNPFPCLEYPMDRGDWQGYSPRGCKELDTTERLTLSLS